jgi:hypothetical protein
MQSPLIEFPSRPHPHVPAPVQPQPPQGHAPTIYVYEKVAWEYRLIEKDLADDSFSEADLNLLGRDGWELVGTVPLTAKVQFYFKRAQR